MTWINFFEGKRRQGMIAVRHGPDDRSPEGTTVRSEYAYGQEPRAPRSGFFFGGRRPGAICKAQKAPAVMVTGAKLCTQPTRALGCGSADSNGLSQFGSRGQRQARERDGHCFSPRPQCRPRRPPFSTGISPPGRSAQSEEPR